MILTVTMNPSVDIAYSLEELNLDTVNRVSKVHKTAGGKGLNVARVLAEFGEQVTATGLIGGSNGSYLLQHLENAVQKSFYEIDGDTRNCIALLHEKKQTEILEDGPAVSEEEGKGFLEHFRLLLQSAETVSISGSLPRGLAEDYYVKLIEMANQSGSRVVLDCSGQALEAVLASASKPAVIKPNKEELSQLLKREVSHDISELKTVLSLPLFEGIEWIIISLGADGVFAKHGQRFYQAEIPHIEIVNPVGSGDSAVAGICSALCHHEEDAVLLKKANTLGMLNAQEKMTGHVYMANYDKLYHQIKVKEV